MTANNFINDFEILEGDGNLLSKIEILSEDKEVFVQEPPIPFTEFEKELMLMPEKKLIWVMQPIIDKQQTMSLGFFTPQLVEKWLWSQRGIAVKYSDRDRNMFLHGFKEKREFFAITFDAVDMPQIVTPDWDHKTWVVRDTKTGKDIKFQSFMTQLTLTYNVELRELYAKCHWSSQVENEKGDWVNISNFCE